MNPLFNALGGGQMPGALGNFQQMMQQFQQFKATFQGDPEQEVRKLIASGKISQNQLNQLQQAAQYQNVSIDTFVDVPAGCCTTISVKNTAGVDIDVQNANLIVPRVA